MSARSNFHFIKFSNVSVVARPDPNIKLTRIGRGIPVPVVFTVMSRQTPLGFEKSLANIAVRGGTPRLLVFRCNVPEKSVLRGERYTAFIAERSW